MKDKIQEYTAVALLVFIIFVLFMFCGCGTKYKAAKCAKWGVCKTVKDSTYIVIKDSTYLVPVSYDVSADSAYMVAYMECDENNKVIMREREITNGKYITLLQDVRNGKYTIIARTKERVDTLYVPTTSHSEVNASTTVREVRVNVLTKWQIFRLDSWPWLVVAVFVGISFIVYKIARFFLK
jgi:hypothetical protein